MGGVEGLGARPKLGITASILIGMITVYRYTLAYFIGGQCRFEPSCSRYGLQAVRSHGAWAGTMLIFKRIGRCHPWNPGGLDPVPPAAKPREQGRS